MIDIKTLEIKGYRFLEVTHHLPKLTLSYIYCTRGLLLNTYWNLEMLQRDSEIIILISEAKDIEGMLKQEITQCSQNAQEIGIYIGMKGKEALLKLVKNAQTIQETKIS